MRIGNGYDVHKLVLGRELVLAEVAIPFHRGLLGHSDGDVLTHAIIDALLGALAKGDIGMIFPDSDERYKDISSMRLLGVIKEGLESEGYKVINIDSVIIAQKPKLSEYINDMRQNIAGCLGISIEQVNIKATTEEGLGFTGAGEGIAAHAVCLIDKIS